MHGSRQIFSAGRTENLRKPADRSGHGVIPVKGEDSENLDQVISRHIIRVLAKTEGKINGPGGAAEVLGLNPSTLRGRMKKLNIGFGKKATN